MWESVRIPSLSYPKTVETYESASSKIRSLARKWKVIFAGSSKVVRNEPALPPTLLNGHPGTLNPDNSKPWRCGDPECEYFEGPMTRRMGKIGMYSRRPEPDLALPVKEQGEKTRSSLEPIWSEPTATDLASKRNDSQAENPNAERTQKGLLAGRAWLHTQGLGTGGSP
jgi:hypothetical protein